MSEAAENLATEDPGLNLIDAIYKRRSVRGYLDREVPREVLDRIFEFVGEEALGKEVAAYHSYGRIPFDLSRIGRWRQDFPSEDREAFIQHCGDLMEAVGYAWAA